MERQMTPAQIAPQIDPKVAAAMDVQEQTGFVPEQPIGQDEIAKAIETLRKYKSGKANLENRIREDDKWWRMRHFELMDRSEFGEEYPSAWLFNSIMGKHAAMMENYPEPNILPREKADEAEARMLSAIVPVVLEMNDFKETYSQEMWSKMQHGNALYSVTWDGKKYNGLGDISVNPVNIMNVFWEPGVRDIQLSRNIFHVEEVHEDVLKAMYPGIDLGVNGDSLSITEFATEDNIDKTGMHIVVDWYYKRMTGTATELHLCKFVGETLLYSSENEGKPWYDDGKYPFVMDVLFPMEGSPAGFGFIDTGKHAQKQIDLLNQAMITNALMNCRPRYFRGNNSKVNEEQFADWKQQLVDVKGPISEAGLQPIEKTGLDGIYVQVLNNKISELKETTSNQDVQTGASGGVTAASAIQALQESAGMPMKDATRGTYRAYEEIVQMVIARIRQFYDQPRMFRIMGEDGAAEFMAYDNHNLQAQAIIGMGGAVEGYRLPEFDIEVVAQAETQYTKLKNNEDVINLFNMGFFNPENADIALIVLDVMDMPRKDKIVEHIKKYRTVHDKMAQYAQYALALTSKYEPEAGPALMQAVQMDLAGARTMPMQAMAQAQVPGAAPAEMGNAQTKREAQTRERAQNTTRPEL